MTTAELIDQCLRAGVPAAHLLDVWQLEPAPRVAYLSGLRTGLRSKMANALSARFGVRPMWPAEEVKAITGVDPMTITGARMEHTPERFTTADPATGGVAAVAGHPMLSTVVNGDDVIAWVYSSAGFVKEAQ